MSVTTRIVNNNTLEILVKEQILKQHVAFFDEDNSSAIFKDRVYEINGEVFREEVSRYNGALTEFEIQTTSRIDRETEITIQETDIYFAVSIQETPYGFIINSNLLLSVNQWNTIVEQDDIIMCLVCDALISNTIEHLNADTHKEFLDRHPPLKKFNLSIMRLIGDYYHCGVCNEVFDSTNDKEHLNNKSHEEKMLFAKNRASEVMSDFDLKYTRNIANGNKNNDCLHFDRDRLLSISETSGFVDACAEDYFYDNNNDTDSDSECVSDNEIANGNEINGISYAMMTKKSAATPKYLDINLNNKIHEMKFEHWHMIIAPKPNQIYCIACKMYCSTNQKSLHCVDKEHKKKLERCRFVHQYLNYYIRQVDHKFVHCGLCNNLQLINDIDMHIKSRHRNKYKSAPDAEFISIRNNDNDINHNIIKTRNTNNEPKPIVPTTPLKTGNDIYTRTISNDNEIPVTKTVKNHESLRNNDESADISSDVIVNEFGCILKLTLMSYNIVTQALKENHLYCHVCNIVKTEFDMKQHIQDPTHMEKLLKIKFQPQFGINLIRMVAHDDHCAICNILFNMARSHLHINESNHIQLLNKALEITNDKLKPVSEMDLNQRVINQSELDLNPTENFQAYLFHKYMPPELSIDESAQDILEKNKFFNEKIVYVKFKSAYIKISLASYNGLIQNGDGGVYCILCFVQIRCSMKKHIESVKHRKCMEDCNFLSEYDEHLLRQMTLFYHCAKCNVIFTNKYINQHITWPPHLQENTDKKIRRNELKSGNNLVNVSFQSENTELKEKEPTIKILVAIKRSETVENVQKKYKIFMVGKNDLKITWDSWHSLCKHNNDHRCILCQCDVKNYELNSHITEKRHQDMLNRFLRRYLPDLIRMVNDTTLNCVTCNVEVSNQDHITKEHVTGKRHKKYYSAVLKKISAVKVNADCDDDILHL